MTNVGKWDRWYIGVTEDEPQTYGDTVTYEIGTQWLRSCAVVYDLGCGKGGFWKVSQDAGANYMVLGVDGSVTPFAGIVTDLATFRDRAADGVFMRHVLEHDYRWRDILENALAMFTERMVLVLFTPMQIETHEIAWNEDPGVPDIGFAAGDLQRIFDDHKIEWSMATYRTNTQYRQETVFLLEKPPL